MWGSPQVWPHGLDLACGLEIEHHWFSIAISDVLLCLDVLESSLLEVSRNRLDKQGLNIFHPTSVRRLQLDLRVPFQNSMILNNLL